MFNLVKAAFGIVTNESFVAVAKAFLFAEPLEFLLRSESNERFVMVLGRDYRPTL